MLTAWEMLNNSEVQYIPSVFSVLSYYLID
jgi:hypothetical protein